MGATQEQLEVFETWNPPSGFILNDHNALQLWALLCKYNGSVTHHNLTEIATKMRGQFQWFEPEAPKPAAPVAEPTPPPTQPASPKKWADHLAQKLYLAGVPQTDQKLSHVQQQQMRQEAQKESQRMAKELADQVKKKADEIKQREDESVTIYFTEGPLAGRIDHGRTEQARKDAQDRRTT